MSNELSGFIEERKTDCLLVQEIFKSKGYLITEEEAKEIWGDYSQGVYFASWMPVAISDTELEEDLLDYAKDILKGKGYKF